MQRNDGWDFPSWHHDKGLEPTTGGQLVEGPSASRLERSSRRGSHASFDQIIHGRPISATQLNFRLRDLLIMVEINRREAAAVASHSCKATVLSWTVEAGERLPDRRLLGGHAKKGKAMPWNIHHRHLQDSTDLKRFFKQFGQGISFPTKHGLDDGVLDTVQHSFWQLDPQKQARTLPASARPMVKLRTSRANWRSPVSRLSQTQRVNTLSHRTPKHHASTWWQRAQTLQSARGSRCVLRSSGGVLRS